MVHQDIRPQNTMVDAGAAVRIIDFGSTKVAGVAEMEGSPGSGELLGTAQYTAPECLLGADSTPQSDIFFPGVVAYQMLTGRLPYRADAAQVRTAAYQRALRYHPARASRPGIPAWVDEALQKAVHPVLSERYEVVSEFIQDLRVPSPAFAGTSTAPLAERDPVRFRQMVSLVLAIVAAGLLTVIIR